MFDPDSAKQVQSFQESRKRNYQGLKPFRDRRVDLIRKYVGRHFSDGYEKKQPVNLHRLFVEVYLQSLVAASPRVLVLSSSPERMADARELEVALDYYLQKMKFGGPLRAWVTESLFSPVSIMKIALTDDCMEDGWLEDHAPGRVFADVISFDDYVCNLNETRWRNAYQGHRYEMDLEDFQNEDKFPQKLRDEVVASMWDEERGPGDAARDLTRPRRSSDDDDFQQFVVLWDIWFPREKLLVTFSDSGNQRKPLYVNEWDGPENGPYHRLQYGMVPDNLMDLPPLSSIDELSESLNEAHRKLHRQASREKQVGVVLGSVEDAEAVRTASDGDVLRSESMQPITELRFGGPDAQIMGFAQFIKENASYVSGNLDVIGGLGQQGDTLGQERILQESSSKRLKEMQNTVVKATTQAIKSVAWYFVRDEEIRIPGLVRPAYPGAQSMIQFDYPDYMGGTFEDFDYQIEPYSMQSQSPGERFQQLRMMWQQDILANPLAQQQGAVPNIQKYLELASKYLNLPELTELVEFVAPEESNPGSPEPRQNPHTVRENVRHNRGGGNNSGQTVQQLMSLGNGAA